MFVRKFAAIFFLSCIFIFSQISEKKGAKNYGKISASSKIEYPGDPSVDIKYYGLNLKITYNPDYLTGSVILKAVPSETSLNTFFLDLQNTMTVDSILLGNEKLQFTHENNKINITLNKTYSSQEEFEITIYYEGQPNTTGFGSFVFDTHGNNEPLIWTLSEPYGASDWFPCKDTPGDKADSSHVWVTVPPGLYAVSNGDLISIIENLDGTLTYNWKNEYPIAQYLISLAVADYTIYKSYFKYTDESGKQDSMPVINYILPENLAIYKSNLDKVPNMLKIMSNYYSLYPFIKEKYGNAEIGWKGGGGMEHQTVSSISNFSEIVLLHELVHQWFGDKITCRDWQDIWLNEGFAKYGEGLYTEAVYGENAFNDFINYEMNNAKKAVGSIYVQNINSISEIFNGNRTYSKGGIVLHMLRGIVGDSVFIKILKSYANDPSVAYGTAVTADFQRVAENVSGMNLSYFFDEWIYGENYPKYKIYWEAAPKENNLYEVSLSVDQLANTNPSFFTMPLQISFSTSVGDTIISFLNNEQDQRVKLIIKGEPSSLTLDPENWVMKDAIIANNNYVSPYSLKLEQNHPNPFNSSTTIDYEVPELSAVNNVPVQLKIYNILGNEVVVLVNEEKSPGKYSVTFDTGIKGKGELASGVYFYSLRAGSLITTKKLIILK
jgi:aminopeptidase N